MLKVQVTRIKQYPFKIYFKVDGDCYFIKDCFDPLDPYHNCLVLYTRKVDECGRLSDVRKLHTIYYDCDDEYYDLKSILVISGRKAQSNYLLHIIFKGDKMSHTKAAFKARREWLGLPQAALAEELSVSVRTLSRWESPSSTLTPTDVAWKKLDMLEFESKQMVDLAVNEALLWVMDAHEKCVPIYYYADQAHYTQAHPTATVKGATNHVALANMNALKTVAKLADLDIDCTLIYPLPLD